AAQQLGEVQSGLTAMSEEVETANAQMAEQSAASQAQMEELSRGLRDSAEGITEIQNGLEEVQTLLDGISSNSAVDQTGLHVPQDYINNEDVQYSIDQYSFGSNEALTMNVILDVDPYSHEAMNILDDVESTVNDELQRLD